MFGPIPAAIVGALGDILSFIIAPTGAYFPGFTINGFITGFIYGMFLYKNNVTPLRVVLAWFTNMLCVETFLSAFWLYYTLRRRFNTVHSLSHSKIHQCCR